MDGGNKMKKIVIMFLVLGLIGVFQNSYSIDYCNSEIVKSWKVERDQAVVRLLKAWLNRAPQELLDVEIAEISAKEIHMATCCPPFDVDDFYIKHVKSTDPMGISITILKTYLKKNGIRLDPRHFFEGKQFCIKKEE